MKIGLISITRDFKKEMHSGNFREFRYAEKELKQMGDVVVLTTDNLIEHDPESFDFFFMTMSAINFFGGVINSSWVSKWNFLAQAHRPIFYWFSDSAIPLVDMYVLVKKKDISIKILELDYRLVSYIHCFKGGEVEDVIESKKYAIVPDRSYYYDLSESYFKYEKMMIPSFSGNKEICYIGNSRGGARNKQLLKYAEFTPLVLYGDWKLDGDFTVNKPFKESLLQEKLNKYFGQLCIYDSKQTQYEMNNFRIAITVASGILPIIDEKCAYDDVPEFAKILIASDHESINRIKAITISQRYGIIKKYQTYLKERYAKQDLIKLLTTMLYEAKENT